MDLEYWLWLYFLITIAAFLLPLPVFIKKKTKNTLIPPLNTSLAPLNISSLSTSPPTRLEYELFLSFRGKDTRTTFTDHLYNDLVDTGIHTFKGDNELRIGENIGPELLKVIEHSKIFIPVFSKAMLQVSGACLSSPRWLSVRGLRGKSYYPFSTMSDHLTCGAGWSYGKAFQQHKKHFDSAIVEEWKETLKEVGKLKGWEVNIVAADG